MTFNGLLMHYFFSFFIGAPSLACDAGYPLRTVPVQPRMGSSANIFRHPRWVWQNIPENPRGIMSISPTKAREKPRGDSPEVFPELLEGILTLSPRIWGNIAAISKGMSKYRHSFHFPDERYMKPNMLSLFTSFKFTENVQLMADHGMWTRRTHSLFLESWTSS